MIHKVIKLSSFYPIKSDANLEIFSPVISDNAPREEAPVILIAPGGGYAFLSNREADPIAIAFMKEGYVAATLFYTVNPDYKEGDCLYPLPQLEALAAIAYLREHHEEYRIDVNKIAMIGFSAGGHLAATTAYLNKDESLLKTLNLEKSQVKLNALVLAYPVIMMGETTHLGSKQRITGLNKDLMELLSAEKHVEKDYPPTFLWNTKEDMAVPPSNSEVFAKALLENNVKHLYLEFDKGWHGLSLVDKNTVLSKVERERYAQVATWFDKCISFLEEVF